MTPFHQFRVWLRRGPRGERTLMGLATLMLVALLVWAAIPLGHERSGVEVRPGAVNPTGNQLGPTGRPPSTASLSSVTTAADGPRPGAPAEATAPGTEGKTGSTDPCHGMTATDQGISPTDVLVAVSVIDLFGAAGNETFNVRSADDFAQVAQAVAAGVNAEGGVACRKLRMKVYKVNPIDQNDQRAKCLEIIGDKPFAVIDVAGYNDPVSRSCFLAAKIPFQGATAVNEEEATAAYPFLYSVGDSIDQEMRNWVFEAAARGTFDPKNGFQKLGLLLDECNPKANAELMRNLANVGVSRDKTSAFTVSGCGGFTSNAQLSQALVQHRNAAVTHVYLNSGATDDQNYVRQADGLRWKPRYLGSKGDAVNSATAPNWSDSFDGAVGITSWRYGERNSGIVHPWVTHCNKWLKEGGARPSGSEGDQIPLTLCDQIRLFVAAANATGPELTRTTLVTDGLARVGRFQPASIGDALFDRRGKVFGGDFIRAIQWHLDCRCWKVVDPDMKPGH